LKPTGSGVPPEPFLNPELTRLAFEERVLAYAENPGAPLLERVRMLSIVGSRLDEFFMTRVARLKERSSPGRQPGMDGFTPATQLDAVVARARTLTDRAYLLLEERLLPELASHDIRLERWSALAEPDRDYVRREYGKRVEAAITPFASGHPFPHVRNLRPAIAAVLRSAAPPAEHIVAIELPGDLPRFLPLSGIGHRFVPLEDVVEALLPSLYPDMEVVQTHLFRVTRSANIDLQSEAADILHAVEQEVARRPFQEVVRLECEASMPPEMRSYLLAEFQREEEEEGHGMLAERDVHEVGRHMDLAALEELASLDLPRLRFPPQRPREPFPPGEALDQVREHDVLLHFPYDSFEATVERMLQESAEDPSVRAIKITLYRAAKDSAIVAAMRTASAHGKEVTAVVEVKASFDEQSNIAWARDLEEAGVRVVLSPAQFKIHAKLALVIRRKGSAPEQVAYIGTGNLNAQTSKAYVDLGLLTADPRITREVDEVFNRLAGPGGGIEFDSLLVAPFDMRRRLVQLIDREIAHAQGGREAGIRLNLNGLTDPPLISALYRASQAGVRVDLMVRDTCALMPGVESFSENISVLSLVGRLLQHARILHFTNGGADEYYIGSADWRRRNLDERVEVVTIVRQPDHQERLDAILKESRSDPGAWWLQPNGEYIRHADGLVAATAKARGRR
jgi:polyphosphate kinase